MALTPTNSHGSSGGGAATIADGADVTEGAIADAAIITNTTGSVSGKLRGIVALLAGTLRVGGDVASDLPVTANPLLVGGRASTALPGAVSADGDAVAAWLTRNGVQVTALATAAGTIAIPNAPANTNNSVDAAAAAGYGLLLSAGGGGGLLETFPFLYNGGTKDRQRNNEQATLLASAARTATTSSADQTNYNGLGVLIAINVSAEAGATTLTLTVQGKDSIAGTYYDLITGIVVYNAAVDTPPILRAVTLYPGVLNADAIGAGAANLISQKSVLLPRIWRATITPSDASSQTYSLSAVTIL